MALHPSAFLPNYGVVRTRPSGAALSLPAAISMKFGGVSPMIKRVFAATPKTASDAGACIDSLASADTFAFGQALARGIDVQNADGTTRRISLADNSYGMGVVAILTGHGPSDRNSPAMRAVQSEFLAKMQGYIEMYADSDPARSTMIARVLLAMCANLRAAQGIAPAGSPGDGTAMQPLTSAELAYLAFWGIASTVSAGAGAYHGYKRNDVPNGSPVGYAIWWALMGGSFPIITPAIAIAQGFGQKATK